MKDEQIYLLLFYDFLKRYGNYYVEEGIESGFIGTVSDLIREYLDFRLAEFEGGSDAVRHSKSSFLGRE